MFFTHTTGEIIYWRDDLLRGQLGVGSVFCFACLTLNSQPPLDQEFSRKIVSMGFCINPSRIALFSLFLYSLILTVKHPTQQCV